MYIEKHTIEIAISHETCRRSDGETDSWFVAEVKCGSGHARSVASTRHAAVFSAVNKLLLDGAGTNLR